MPGRSPARTHSGLPRAARAIASVVLVALVAGLTACSAADGPRRRIGSLPFPGFMTRYRPLAHPEPGSLGRHQFDRIRFSHEPQGPEVDHGILYTCRAGFLDLAHLRTVVDWAWYGRERFRAAMLEDRWFVRIDGPDYSWYNVTLTPPEGWGAMNAEARAAWIDEAALRSGQRLAYIIMTWHEIATWYGYRTVPIIPENLSAFTYDDVMSHVIGVRVAERAMRSGIEDFDEAATRALDDELEYLRPVDAEAVRRATQLVHHKWWVGRDATRQIEAGLENGYVTPWLVPGLTECAGQQPQAFALPWVDQPGGEAACFHIHSALWETPRIRRVAGLARGEPIAEEHLTTVINAIREDVESRDEQRRADRAGP